MRNLCADEAAQRKIEDYTLPQSMVLTGFPLMHVSPHNGIENENQGTRKLD